MFSDFYFKLILTPFFINVVELVINVAKNVIYLFIVNLTYMNHTLV